MTTRVVVQEPEELDWEGPWEPSVNYVPGDVVTRNGSSFRATSATVGEDPELTPLKWEVVARKGDKGDKGEPGEPGTPGAPGAAPQAYFHEQGIPSDVWVIHHNLGYDPNYSAEDSAGTPMEGVPSWPVYGVTMHITYNSSVGGKARLS